MLYSLNALSKAKVKSLDFAYGDIRDLYFDDVSWVLRYFVVDMGSWKEGRYVLLSPESFTEYRNDEQVFVSKLTRQQIHESPPFDTQNMVTRQHEESLSRHFGWTPYWTTPMAAFPLPGLYSYPIAGGMADRLNQENELSSIVSRDPGREQDMHLRSFQEIKKYGLQATDGDIGELDDILLDAVSWRLTHLIVDARLWWPGGQVVIDRTMVKDIIWEDAKIVLAMSRDDVKKAPPYDPDQRFMGSFPLSHTEAPPSPSL